MPRAIHEPVIRDVTPVEESDPLEPHHHYLVLAVHADDQAQGIGHALLDYLEDKHRPGTSIRTSDTDTKVRSVIEPPDGPPISAMWRSPMA